MRLGGITAVAVVLATSPALAIDFNGVEFQAATYTLCNQREPAVDGLPDGGFVVVWGSGSYYYPQDGSWAGVFGQRFNASGLRVGTEFQVNTYTTDVQTVPDVAVRPAGDFVVVWTSYDQEGSGSGSYYSVFGRRYDASGLRVGTEFAVNTYTLHDQYRPSVSITSTGFVVVWESYTQDGDEEGIFGQRFNLMAMKVGTEFRINTETEGRQRFPHIAAASDDSFVVVWTSTPRYGPAQDGSGSGVFGQRFGANGLPDGTEFQANSYTTDDQVRARVSTTTDGGFLVVWESPGLEGAAGSGDAAAIRKFDDTGMPVGAESAVNSYTTGSQQDVRISATGNGDFLVTWESEGGVGATDTGDSGVFARRVDSDGQPIGTEFQVNTYTTNDQEDADVAALVGGGFAVVWESDYQDGHQIGSFGQAFSGPRCGDGSEDGNIAATDALVALVTGVGAGNCPACICDVDRSGGIAATDAFTILQFGVGQPVILECIACL